MTCTMAFDQGIVMFLVQYMVIFKLSYRLVPNNHVPSLVGQDGMESHMFFLVETVHSLFRVSLNDQCVNELEDIVYGKQCRCLTNMLCMDGHYLAVCCIDKPQGIYCNMCDPNSVMQ